MGTRVWGAAAVVLAAALACNGGLEPAPVCGKDFVGICGTVTFQGQEPESTQGVFIVAYPTFPQSRTDLLNNFLPRPPLQSLLRPFTSQQSYAVQLPSGRYEWVLAVWLKQGAVPTPTNALGVRGGGEGGATPALAVIVNAVVDALSEYGVTHFDLPLTAERIWRAIDNGRRV